MSQYNTQPFLGDEEDEEQSAYTQEYNFKECHIYAIDCSPSMWSAEEDDNDSEPPVISALKCIRGKVLDSLYSRPNDQIGIILYATEEHQNDAGKDHICILQPLNTAEPTRLKELDALISDPSIVRQNYGSTNEPFPISDLFWLCSDMLSKAPKQSSKRIIIITDQDNPTHDNNVYSRAAVQRATDLTGNGVNMVVFGLDRPEQKFDKVYFYKRFCTFEDDEQDDIEDEDAGNQNNPDVEFKLLSATGKVKELFKKLRTLQTKRSEFRLPFQVGPKLTIGIRGYNMIIKQKIAAPKYFYSSGEQLKEVKTTTRWKREGTDEYLLPSEIQYSYEYGGEEVVFTKAEVEKMKTVNEPGLYVLGFRDASALKMYHQLTHPYFIYPDESQYIGSRKVYTALVKTMLKKKKMAICNLTRRANSMARLAAVLPQNEELDAEGNVIIPAGLQVIILPFADEIRPLPPYTVPESDDKFNEAVKALKPIIRNLTVDTFDPSMYHNPALQSHKNLLLRTALGTDNVPEVKDDILPDYDLINEKCGEAIEKFKEIVGLQNLNLTYEIEQTTSSRKRPGASDAPSSEPKRIRMRDRTIPDHWEYGSLDTVTNASLKDFLTSVGIHPKRVKKDMIEQIDTYLRAKVEGPSSQRQHQKEED